MGKKTSEWNIPIIEGINAMFPDDLKPSGIKVVKNPDTLTALQLLIERRYDDETLWKVIRACAFWTHFPERPVGYFDNRELMRNSEAASQALYKILRSKLDGTGSDIALFARQLWLGAPDLDDKTIMLGLLLLKEYFSVFGGPRKKKINLCIPGLLRSLHLHLIADRPEFNRRVHALKERRAHQAWKDGVYEAIGLLRYVCFDGRKVKATSIRKEIERYARDFPPDNRNK